LRISLDRELPVSISAQLKGQIEYGIVSGALKPGEQLPSVRDLAATEGIAHVTVSHVYRDLKRDGLIVVRPGMGTYVADSGNGHGPGGNLGHLQRMVDTMVTKAIERGFSATEISQMVTARLAGGLQGRPLIALVGIFAHATGMYAHDLRLLLEDLDPEVAPFTIEELRSAAAEQLAQIRGVDLVLTLANKVQEVQMLLPAPHPPVRALTFTMREQTVQQLEALPEGLQLGVVSTFGEFLHTMLSGISTHITLTKPPICAVLADTQRVNAVLAQADAIIYATGSEAIVPLVERGKPVIEYLHTPDPASVRDLRPIIERVAAAHGGEGRDARKGNDSGRADKSGVASGHA
jgi:DNA-binding transcriptional regulator YhcF (GntR family)